MDQIAQPTMMFVVKLALLQPRQGLSRTRAMHTTTATTSSNTVVLAIIISHPCMASQLTSTPATNIQLLLPTMALLNQACKVVRQCMAALALLSRMKASKPRLVMLSVVPLQIRSAAVTLASKDKLLKPKIPPSLLRRSLPTVLAPLSTPVSQASNRPVRTAHFPQLTLSKVATKLSEIILSMVTNTALITKLKATTRKLQAMVATALMQLSANMEVVMATVADGMGINTVALLTRSVQVVVFPAPMSTDALLSQLFGKGGTAWKWCLVSR